MGTLDEDVSRHFAEQLFFSHHWHLLYDFFVFIGDQDAISVLYQVDYPHFRHLNFHCDLFLEVHNFSLLDDVVHGSLDLVVLRLPDDVGHADLHFFDLLSCLVDVVRHFHDPFYLDVLSASRLD